MESCYCSDYEVLTVVVQYEGLGAWGYLDRIIALALKEVNEVRLFMDIMVLF